VRIVALVWLGAAGCRHEEERFLVDGVDALCAAAAGCAGTYEPAACVDALRGGLTDACVFDPDAADECVAEIEEGPACEAIEPFDLRALAIPDACVQAWDCGKNSEPWTAPLTQGLPTPSGQD
jgi:hypothetical protein